MTDAITRLQAEIADLRAALAQKTRECEELRKDLDEMTADRNLWWKREGIAQTASTRLQAQVEQLERQVAELKAMLPAATES